VVLACKGSGGKGNEELFGMCYRGWGGQAAAGGKQGRRLARTLSEGKGGRSLGGSHTIYDLTKK